MKRRVVRGGAAWLLLFLLGGFGAAQGERAPAALERAFAEARTTSDLRRRLAGLEARELPQLFRVCVSGRLASAGASAARELDEEARQVARESLAARPRRELLPMLEDLAGQPGVEPADRREAQLLLEAMGSAEHVRLLARVTVPFQERGHVAPELRSGFQRALAAILARDPSALAQLSLLFSESPPGLSSSIVEALASVRKPAATRLLAGLLGRSPGLDPLLLARLAERGRVRSSGEEPVLDAVRRYLRQRDPALVAAAARAAGQLGDDGAVETLIELLEHPEERVRQGVFAALGAISGLDFGHEAARWTSWYHAEMRWWEGEAEAQLARVERGRGVEFARASRAVLEHRLFRDRVAEAFTQALRRGSAEEARLSCQALEQLRSPVAVRGLVECLDSPDTALREAAWRALRAITGVELPPESDSWAELAG